MLKNPTDLKSIDSSSAKRHLCPFFFFFFGKSWRLAFHKEITYIKIYVKCVCGILMTKKCTKWVKLRENITTCSELC